MKHKAIKKAAGNHDLSRHSIAGDAWVSDDFNKPECGVCGTAMQLFFQFDVEPFFDLKFKPGSHFALFMCPHCNEIPSFERYPDGKLPSEFWLKTERHFFPIMFQPGNSRKHLVLDGLLKNYGLEYIGEEGEKESGEISVGGAPIWVQAPESYTCQCGSNMHLLCQIPENYAFPKLQSAPAQPDSFSDDDYCLFLGNEIYVFACEKQCDERAVWITVQN